MVAVARSPAGRRSHGSQRGLSQSEANGVVSKNPIDAKTECLLGRGLDSWMGRPRAADDPRIYWFRFDAPMA